MKKKLEQKKKQKIETVKQLWVQDAETAKLIEVNFYQENQHTWNKVQVIKKNIIISNFQRDTKRIFQKQQKFAFHKVFELLHARK